MIPMIKLYHRMSKSTLKNKFFGKQLKIKPNTGKIKADFKMYLMGVFDFKWR